MHSSYKGPQDHSDNRLGMAEVGGEGAEAGVHTRTGAGPEMSKFTNNC